MKKISVFILTMSGFLPLLACSNLIAQKTIDPLNTDASLVCVTNKGAVWLTKELVEETQNYVAQSFINRFYLQDLTEPNAALIHTVENRNSGYRATVTDEGIVVIESGGRITWLADGASKFDLAQRQSRPILYPDGIVAGEFVEGHTPHSYRVNFIPFKNQSLDLNSKVELIPAGTQRYDRRLVVRDGNRLAWLSFAPRQEGDRSKTGLATLHIYNIEDSKHTTQKLDVPLWYEAKPTALGEGVFVVGGMIFDVESGECLNPDSRNSPSIFAIKNGIGYYYKHRRPRVARDPDAGIGTLYAVDLLNPERPSMEIATLSTRDPAGVVVGTDAGLLFWDREGWHTTEWIEKWPDPQVDNN